jgi:predicted nucleic acid-binding protein
MALLVIDSSVVIKWFLTEPLADKAHAILDEMEQHRIQVVVPDILHAEIANILWKKCRFQGFDRNDCEKYLSDFEAMSLPFVPISRLFMDAFQLAVQHHRSVYDMLYVALAEREGCRFVTADERLMNAVAGSLPSVVGLASWTIAAS